MTATAAQRYPPDRVPPVATQLEAWDWHDAMNRLVELIRSPGNRIRIVLLHVGLPLLGWIVTGPTVEGARKCKAFIRFYSAENRTYRRLLKNQGRRKQRKSDGEPAQ